MGGEMRAWGVDTLEVLLDKKGAAAGLRVVDLDWSAGKPERIAGSEHEVPAQLVLIACGFTGPEHGVFDAVRRACCHRWSSAAGDGRRRDRCGCGDASR